MKINDLNASYMRDVSTNLTNKPENKLVDKQEQNSHKLEKQEEMKKHFSELSSIGAKGISNAYFMQFQAQTFSFSNGSFSFQSFSFGISSDNSGNFLSFLQNPTNKIKGLLSGIDLSQIGYNGKPIHTLSQDEAKALVSEDGFFGITKTSERIADFVINGAGNDLEKLKAGKDGMLRGFEQAEQMWGGKLPDISQETMQKALAKIDEKISALGGNALDIQA